MWSVAHNVVFLSVCEFVTPVSLGKTTAPTDPGATRKTESHRLREPCIRWDYVWEPPGEYDLKIRVRQRCRLSLPLLQQLVIKYELIMTIFIDHCY